MTAKNINVNDNAVNDHVVMTAGNVNSGNNNNVQQDKTKTAIDRAKIQVEYQSCQKSVLNQSRNNYAALNGTAWT